MQSERPSPCRTASTASLHQLDRRISLNLPPVHQASRLGHTLVSPGGSLYVERTNKAAEIGKNQLISYAP